MTLSHSQFSQCRRREHGAEIPPRLSDHGGPPSAEVLLVELAETACGDPYRDRLRERLVEMHLPIAKSVARRYRNKGEPFEDLVQVACVGLLKAINGYDHTLGHNFLTYAMPVMTGEVKRHFRDKTWAIRVPRRYQEQRMELNKLTVEQGQRLGHTPTVAELARMMQLSEDEIMATLGVSAAYSLVSLDAPLNGQQEAGSVGDTVAYLDDALSRVVDWGALQPLIGELPSRERRILLLRFYGNKTQAEIAEELGISQMHVSRLLNQTFARLRRELLKEGK